MVSITFKVVLLLILTSIMATQQTAKDTQTAGLTSTPPSKDEKEAIVVNDQELEVQEKPKETVTEATDNAANAQNNLGDEKFAQSYKELLDKIVQQKFNNLQGNEGNINDGQLEEQKQEEQNEENKEKLNQWITEEIQNNVLIEEGLVLQTFQVSLDSGKTFNFRWNPPKSQTLHIKLMVFEMMDDGGLTLMRDNEKEEFIGIEYRDEGRNGFTNLGKVYIQRAFAFNFDTDYKYFRLTNNIAKSVLLIVDLERLQETLNIESTVKNDHFSTTVKKLEGIRQEVVSGQKLREHSYKYQWGFLDNQYAHDSRLLGLTGFELIIMIAAAVIQIYFIKSLLDNRAVV